MSTSAVSGIVLLTTAGESGRLVTDRLRKEFEHVTVIQEQKVARSILIRGRYRRLGLLTTLGQLVFMAAIMPLLRRESRARRHAILADWNCPVDSEMQVDHRVESVNTEQTRDLLTQLAPSVVVVNGTRIIGRKTLSCVTCPFVNMHAGITPLYRGVHGAYWALAEERPELVGTTIHLVDEGVDTGSVLEQICFSVEADDNFISYPLLQVLHGLSPLMRQVRALSEGEVNLSPPLVQDSKMRYHPTVFTYLRNRLGRGIR